MEKTIDKKTLEKRRLIGIVTVLIVDFVAVLLVWLGYLPFLLSLILIITVLIIFLKYNREIDKGISEIGEC